MSAKSWRFIPLVLCLLLLGFFAYVELSIDQGEYDSKDLPSTLIGKTLPPFALNDLLTGEALSNDRLLGQWAIVNIWASWCPSCDVEHPFLMRLADSGELALFGLNYKDGAAQAKAWLAPRGNPYRAIIFDPVGDMGLDMGVTGAPETFLIDPQGFVRARYQGALDADVWEQHFAPWIRGERTAG